MKLLSGAVLLVGAEQAYAHALLVQFPNQESAATVLVPASLVLSTLGSILMLWGLLTECRSLARQKQLSSADGGSAQ